MICIRIADFCGLTQLPNDRGSILLENPAASVARAGFRLIYLLSDGTPVVIEEKLSMPAKGWLIGFADQSKRQCREQLRRNIAMAVDELLADGWDVEFRTIRTLNPILLSPA